MSSNRADRLRDAANRALGEPADSSSQVETTARRDLRVGHTMSQVAEARAENAAQHAGDPPDSAAKEVGAAQVQHKMDEQLRKGFYGEVPDDTPNHHYSVGGVTRKLPTPEAPTPPIKQK